MMRQLRCLLCVVLLALNAGVHAQAWPAKPIRIVAPFPPGGGVDITARLLQNEMARGLNQPIIIDNRAGAGGGIGAEYVARSAPDGYTVLFTAGSDLVLRHYVNKTWTLDAFKD